MKKLHFYNVTGIMAFFILLNGCSNISSEQGLLNAAKKNLIEEGQIFQLYPNFRSIKSIDRVTENTYNAKVEYSFGLREGIVKIKEIEFYRIYNDPVFYKYVSLGNYREDVEKGFIQAVGNVTIEDGSDVFHITSVLMKNEQNKKLEWNFITKNFSPYHRLLETMQQAYTEIKDEEFLKLIGK